MATTTATIEERVAKGAALMDAKVPGWEKRIDANRLDMASCVDCVLGQAFCLPKNDWTIFQDAATSLGLDTYRYEDVSHGFNVDQTNGDYKYEALRTAWLAEITRRLNVNTTEATS